MKKLLILLPLLAIISCSPDRVLEEELINKGTEESPMLFYAGESFTGIAFGVYPNDELKFEYNVKDGKVNGYGKSYYENGQLKSQAISKNGRLDGLYQVWYENGQLHFEGNSKDGNAHGLYREWDENGILIEQSNWNEGVRLD